MLQFVVKNTLRNLKSLSSQIYSLSDLATGKILLRDVILTIVLAIDLIQLLFASSLNHPYLAPKLN